MQCTRRFQPMLRVLGRAHDHHSSHHKIPDFTKTSAAYVQDSKAIPDDLALHLLEIQHSINNLTVRLTMYEQNLHRFTSQGEPISKKNTPS